MIDYGPAMNQHSPGRHADVEDGIEWVGIRQELPVHNGDAGTQQDDEDADDNQALLRTGTFRVPRYLGRKGSFVKVWPQIKGIVVEVRAAFSQHTGLWALNLACRALLHFF
jgi:hypothetical protein